MKYAIINDGYEVLGLFRHEDTRDFCLEKMIENAPTVGFLAATLEVDD